MTRTRSTTLYSTTQGPYYWRDYNDNNVQLSVYSSSPVNYKTKVIVDSVTPQFWTKVRDGEFLPINTVDITTSERVIVPYSGSTSFTHTGTITASPTHSSGTLFYLHNMNGLPAYAPSQSDIDSVVIQALAKAKSPDWDILTFAGELPQTISLLRTAMLRVFGVSRKIARRALRRETRRAKRQRRRYDPQKALREFAQLWLEGRYGWRPLMYDIDDIVTVLRKKSQSPIARRSFRKSFSINQTASPATTTSGGAFTITGTHNRLGDCSIRAVVYHRSDMARIGANPIITAYELTRFSFVVDWFIDIGSWLQAISPRVGYNQLGVSVSWKASYVETQKWVWTSGTWVTSMSPQTIVDTVERYHREAYSGIPLPSIQVNLNQWKVADLIALALQGRGEIFRILKL